MIYNVGKYRNFKTINEAYTAAKSGDILYIDEGIYPEQIHMNTKYVHIIGNNKKGLAQRGKVVIKPISNLSPLKISYIMETVTVYIEGVTLQLTPVIDSPISSENANSLVSVVTVESTSNLSLIFNKCTLNATSSWKYIFNTHVHHLQSVTVINCRLVWQADFIRVSGAIHFVNSYANYYIRKSVLLHSVHNIHSQFWTPIELDYVLQDKVGYGPAYGSILTDVGTQYYLSGKVIDYTAQKLIDNVKLSYVDKHSSIVLINDSKSATVAQVNSIYLNNYTVLANIGKYNGKWYWEISCDNVFGVNSYSCVSVGVCNNRHVLNKGVGTTVDSWGYRLLAKTFVHDNKILRETFIELSITDRIGVALNLNDGNMWISINGEWLFSGDPALNVNPVFTGIRDEIYPAVSIAGSPVHVPICNVHFSLTDLMYTVPDGYSFFGSDYNKKITCIREDTNEIVGVTYVETLNNSYYIETPYDGYHYLLCQDITDEYKCDIIGKIKAKRFGV